MTDATPCHGRIRHVRVRGGWPGAPPVGTVRWVASCACECLGLESASWAEAWREVCKHLKEGQQ